MTARDRAASLEIQRKQMAVFQVDGEKIVVRTTRNRRARRMTLRIDAANDCAVLVLPSRAFVGASETDQQRWADTIADYLAGPAAGAPSASLGAGA